MMAEGIEFRENSTVTDMNAKEQRAEIKSLQLGQYAQN